MRAGRIMDGLNPEQQRAVQAVRGPVCVLAGAGAGKTTTITRRVANQVAMGTFGARQILAVTFTDKAAAEMRDRLRALGAGDVMARTFHSAALSQLRNLAQEPPGRILASKAIPLRQLANSLPKPFRFRPVAELATEVEWAKNRRVSPSAYPEALGDHEPPIPADLMQGIYARYESGKRYRDLVDFEDILELAVRLYEEDPDARERFAARYSAFTVDEYQDVNTLQQALLERWLDGRDDLCVVGDDYQSIYAFTGASPRHLLEMPRRFERTTVVRLETNYRSTPQILDFANRLAPRLGGARKVLRTDLPEGPEPEVRPFASAERELGFVVEHIRELLDAGLAPEDIAVLYRANYRSEDYEEALSDARIPFQVKDGNFLARQAARRVLGKLGPRKGRGVEQRVRQAALSEGWREDLPEGLGEQEETRQRDFGRLVQLAESFDEGGTVGDFENELIARFSPEGPSRGVNLLTLHRAKGLEFEAVFVVRLEEGEMPFKRAKTDEAVAEERRLLYVGLTRAKRHLVITRVAMGASPSRFLAELGIGPNAARKTKPTSSRPAVVAPDDPALVELRRWRLNRARADNVPAYVVFHDDVLSDIAALRPSSLGELAGVSGIGPSKLDRYGDEVLEALGSASDDE